MLARIMILDKSLSRNCTLPPIFLLPNFLFSAFLSFLFFLLFLQFEIIFIAHNTSLLFYIKHLGELIVPF